MRTNELQNVLSSSSTLLVFGKMLAKVQIISSILADNFRNLPFQNMSLMQKLMMLQIFPIKLNKSLIVRLKLTSVY